MYAGTGSLELDPPAQASECRFIWRVRHLGLATLHVGEGRPDQRRQLDPVPKSAPTVLVDADTATRSRKSRHELRRVVAVDEGDQAVAILVGHVATDDRGQMRLAG